MPYLSLVHLWSGCNSATRTKCSETTANLLFTHWHWTFSRAWKWFLLMFDEWVRGLVFRLRVSRALSHFFPMKFHLFLLNFTLFTTAPDSSTVRIDKISLCMYSTDTVFIIRSLIHIDVSSNTHTNSTEWFLFYFYFAVFQTESTNVGFVAVVVVVVFVGPLITFQMCSFSLHNKRKTERYRNKYNSIIVTTNAVLLHFSLLKNTGIPKTKQTK